MKRELILVLITVSIIALCCDEEMHYEFIIENSCKSELIVNLKPNGDNEKTISIAKEKADTVYDFTIIEGMHIDEKKIDKIFTYINIQCNTIPSKIDYLSNEVWYYDKKSESHAVYYLEVDSTHFE